MVNLEKKVVGIDVSSKFLTVSFKNEKDQEMVYNVSNLKTGINGFLKKIKNGGIQNCCRSHRFLQ